MNYSEDSAIVRVDFFKEKGKWYCTENVVWYNNDNEDIYNEFAKSLMRHLVKNDGKYRLIDMWAVCLEPYHKHAHPLMRRVADLINSV